MPTETVEPAFPVPLQAKSKKYAAIAQELAEFEEVLKA
jgi:hypothetical protein